MFANSFAHAFAPDSPFSAQVSDDRVRRKPPEGLDDNIYLVQRQSMSESATHDAIEAVARNSYGRLIAFRGALG